MYQGDNNQIHPAVPPLYPMDPCRPMPQPRPYEPPMYEPQPMPYEPPMYEPQPMPYEPPMDQMPYMDCPMMDPRFRDCVRACMKMRCGDYPMDTGYAGMDYDPMEYIDLHKLSPYYDQDEQETE